MRLRWKIGGAVGIIALVAMVFLVRADSKAGQVVDTYKGVAIYDNGPLIAKSHGKHFSPAGYYWGQKWQCVEYVKRFYDVAKGHQMPDVWGHAKDFFDEKVGHGEMNAKRGLRQFRNGRGAAPRVDDLVVLTGAYGHVAIVSEVGSNFVEVAQQNIYGKPRERWGLVSSNGTWRIERVNLVGWLRKDGEAVNIENRKSKILN